MNAQLNPTPASHHHQPANIHLPLNIPSESAHESNASYSVSQQETFSQRANRIYNKVQTIIQMAHYTDITDFTNCVHEWLSHFESNSIDDHLRYKIMSRLIGFNLYINMNSVHRKLRRTHVLHLTGSLYNKTFFIVSSLAEHIFFEPFQFHFAILNQRMEQSQSSFSHKQTNQPPSNLPTALPTFCPLVHHFTIPLSLNPLLGFLI